MPSFTLYMSPYPHFKTTTLSIYDNTCPLLMTSHALYMTSHLLCMISHSLYVWHHTMTYLWYHTLYVYDKSSLYGITHSVMTTQQLCNFTATMSDITPTVSVSSHPLDQFYQTKCMTPQPLCVWHHMHYMWHHIHNLGHHTTLCMTSGPLYLTSLPLYLCHHTHPIDDIRATICTNSHPVYMWHHIHYIYDIISIKCDITTLCVDDATLGICMTSFALQMTT